jgi:N-acetylneuraminate synthase
MKKTTVIAEIGQAHDGSLGILHSYIDALAETGVDAVKFQTHIAEAESSCHEPFRVNFSYEDQTRFEYWKRMEFTHDQWRGIKQHCEDKGLIFITSPFSNAAVDLLESIKTNVYKIGSGEISNLLMLEKIARTGKSVIMSSGMSSFKDLDRAISFLVPFQNQVSILQCTSKYPTTPEDIGLNLIGELKKRYGLPTGLSDHSGTVYPSLSAVTLGAELIEVHAVFDRRMFGPDAKASLTIDEIAGLVKGIRYTEIMRDAPVEKDDTAAYTNLKQIFEKSLAVNKSLSAGHRLKIEDLEGKKPKGYGMDASEYANVIGKKLKTDKSQWAFLKKEDIDD